MKKGFLSFFLFTAFALALCPSCKDDETAEWKNVAFSVASNLAPENGTIPYEGSTVVFTVTTDGKWTYAIDQSKTDWFTHPTVDGMTLAILIPENTVSRERSGVVRFISVSDPTLVEEFTITQEPGPVPPEAGRYYHVVGVWDKTAEKAYIYVDGQLKGTADAPGELIHAKDGARWFALGGDSAVGSMGNAWNGEVVLARVFDDALTGDQIALLYQDAAFAGQTPVEFALSNLTYLTRCEIGAGYTYTVYGNGFAAGDKVKFTSSANVTAAFTADAAFTEASGDNTLQSLAVTLPAGIPAGTGRYFMALVRNGSQYPLGTVEFTVCVNPSVSMPRIIAHRGQHQDGVENSTENSIAALTNAQKLGIHGAEFDVWITADDVPVINHNATVAGSDLRIEESAYAQIRDLTLANGEKLPTLDAYLEQGAKDASMKLICEIKTHSSAASNTRAVNAVVAAVKAKSMETRVDYIAFDYEVCKQLRAAMPAAGVQYLGGDKAPAEVAADKLSGIDYQYSTVLSKKPEWVTEAHAGGIEVNAWTVNSTADMMACIALGVDYITTDNPATLKKLLETPFVTAPK